jgi:hypothetical protein
MRISMLLFLLVVPAIKGYTQQDSLPADSALLKKIEQEMSASQTAPAAPVRTSPSVNPDISVIGDFRSHYISDAQRKFNANLNETEFSFMATVDPYVKASFFYSVSRDELTGKFSGEIEEGYVTTLSLPAHLQLKAGKFKSAVGRINPVHEHALPFISLPNAYVNYFGDDGLNDEGFSLSWLLPNSLFYQELTLELTDGPYNNPSFERSSSTHLMTLAHLKNFWDLSRNATIEFGISGITGENDSAFTTNMAAADLTYKWKPLQKNTYRSFTWQSELYFSNARMNKNTIINSLGFYSMINVQVAQRWFTCAKYDYSNLPFNNKYIQQSYSLTLGWYATEFQKIELEGKTTASNIEARNYEALLRWIFVIGSHGAHQY